MIGFPRQIVDRLRICHITTKPTGEIKESYREGDYTFIFDKAFSDDDIRVMLDALWESRNFECDEIKSKKV